MISKCQVLKKFKDFLEINVLTPWSWELDILNPHFSDEQINKQERKLHVFSQLVVYIWVRVSMQVA